MQAELENIHFLHIGKTGGTALTSVLKAHPVTHQYAISVHFHDVRLTDIPTGEKVFFFLRDPISRFISSFYSRQRQGRPRYNFAWSAEEERAFGLFKTANDLGEALADESGERYEHAANAMQDIYHVKSSYYDWFIDDEYFISRAADVMYIGFQESLAADFIKLKSILGLPPEAELPTDDIGAHRNPANVDRHIGDIAAEALKKWYKKEYHFVQMCKNLLAEHRIACG